MRTWLSFLGAALLASASPVVYGAAVPSAAQTTTKKKTSTSKSKRRRKVAGKPKGQKAPTEDRVKEIQSALQKEGVYQGEPNGKWDDATVNAMKAYQDKNGLSPTGKIDALTLQKLGLGSDTAGKGAPVPSVSSLPSQAPASATTPSASQQ